MMKEVKNTNKTNIKEIMEYVPVIIGAVVITVIVSYFLKLGQVVGKSMTNTLQDKDILLINKVAYKFHAPEYKDIVVIKTNVDDGNVFIKRVIGVPGDNVAIKDNQVYVNGKALEEKYIREAMVGNEDMEMVVPEGKIFVMGDNRNNSLDSRNLQVGMVDYKEAVIGKAAVRLFPFKSIPKY